MTHLASPSPEELALRRRALRRQRRIRNLQTLWRGLAVSGMTTATLWSLWNPFWLLRTADQVKVVGNQILSDQAIQTLLPLDYPLPLLDVQPDHVAEFLEKQAPIAEARVSRHLLPPRLEVFVRERRPVAVTVPARLAQAAAEPSASSPLTQPGLLDAQGNWMAQTSVTLIDPDFEQPLLRVRGFRSPYQRQWSSLYQAIQTSPVEVIEVDWRSPNNLILQTQLGTVHLGIYDPHAIQQQLVTLAQLQSLTQADNAPAVEYIDLSNPQNPAIKVTRSPQARFSADSPP